MATTRTSIRKLQQGAYVALVFGISWGGVLLMVWVYDRTGSLLVAMLMHASLTASVRVFDPLAISGMPLLTYNLVLAAVLWVVVAGGIVYSRFYKHPLRAPTSVESHVHA